MKLISVNAPNGKSIADGNRFVETEKAASPICSKSIAAAVIYCRAKSPQVSRLLRCRFPPLTASLKKYPSNSMIISGSRYSMNI